MTTQPSPLIWSAEFGCYVDEAGKPIRSARVQRNIPFALRIAAFVLIFVALHLRWAWIHEAPFGLSVIHDWTVVPAVGLVNSLTPSVHAWADHASMRAVGGGLNILNGCEGTELLFLLIAAFLVAPMSWQARVAGLLLGVPVVFAINQVRILALFYAYRANHALFDLLHGAVTPVATVILVVAYFYAWLAHATRPAATA